MHVTRTDPLQAADNLVVAPKFGIAVADVPGPAKAAALATFLLRTSRTTSWSDLAERIAAEDPETLRRLSPFRIEASQQQILDAHRDILTFIRTTPPQTICICDTCGMWMIIGKRTVPAGCRLTIDCPGKMIKAPRAKKVALAANRESSEFPTSDGDAQPDTLDATQLPRTDVPATNPEHHSPGPGTPTRTAVDARPGETDRDQDHPVGVDPRYDVTETVEPSDFAG